MENRRVTVSFTVMILMASILLLTGCGSQVKVNSEAMETGMAKPEAFSVYGGEDIGFSFLYPKGLATSYSKEDGAAIFGQNQGEAPYLLVHRTNEKGMTPEKYFKQCDKTITEALSEVQSTPIYEVPLGEKTLYMTRYVGKQNGAEVVIDRYLELYPKCYIQYTAVSGKEGEMNTALYYAAQTLRTNGDAYVGGFSEKLTGYEHPELALSISLPDMLEVKELTIGYFASSENVMLLCIESKLDDAGTPIYNRQDFMDRATRDPGFVAGYLGADSAEFAAGEEITLGGRSYYCYPMTLNDGGETYTGLLCLANAEETGCLLLCYAVRDGSPQEEKVREVCTKSLESIQY